MTAEHGAATPASSERGFVIVAVLWILAALSALAVIFSVYLSNSAQALAVNDTGLRVETLVSASLELAAYQLLLAGDKARPSQGAFQFRLDNADVQVSFASETARIDLNFAPKEMLAGFFAGLGADQTAAREYADRIAGWRTRPVPNAANDEAALYAAAGLTYAPRQSLFTHVNELSLVLGLPPGLVDRALPFVTVFNGSSGVDVLIAAPEVIAALPGMTPSNLRDFLNERAGLSKDGSAIAAALGPAKANAEIPKSMSFRVLTAIRFNDGRRSSSEVVMTLGGKDDPYRVLSWQDDIGPGRGSGKRAALR
ncbi:MAG: ral secretion pathway protein [Tardiphaga sp.]|nr:ral secretion pathway protein [Tardiphaga sp.]